MIFITGGTGTFGKVLIRHYMQASVPLALCVRDRARLFSMIPELHSSSGIEVIEADLMAPSGVKQIQEAILERALPIRGAIHLARSLDSFSPAEDGRISAQSFMNEYYLSVVVPYLLTIDLSQLASYNNTVFVGSIYGVVGPTPSLYGDDFNTSSNIRYGTAKAALIHLTKELAVRLGPKVRVNCVSFGGVRGRTDKHFEERYKSLNPQRHMMNPDDIVGPLDFLLSDASGNMTGHNLIVDNGWTTW